MPNKTKMLDYGGFVHSPKVPVDETFTYYLRDVDQLFAQWQQAFCEWNQSPFSAELLERKKAAESDFDRYIAAYQDKYTIKHVERDPTFLPVAQFSVQHRPIREPFSLLHCSLDMPLHTVLSFQGKDDLARVNAALREDTPLRWWQNGPLNHPCYLFGEWIWELKPAELSASDKGLVLLFEQTSEKDRHRRDRLQHNLANPGGGDQEYIPEAVRVFVWRRDGGKCAKCNSRDGLEFRYVVPANRGGNGTADNLRLLCQRCHEKQLALSSV